MSDETSSSGAPDPYVTVVDGEEDDEFVDEQEYREEENNYEVGEVSRSRAEESGTVTLPTPALRADSTAPTACAKRASFHSKSFKDVRVVYTDIFLDVGEFERDVKALADRVVLPRLEQGDKVVLVCSATVYRYLTTSRVAPGAGARRAPRFSYRGVDLHVADPRAAAPIHLDGEPSHVIFFNVDPFDRHLYASPGRYDNMRTVLGEAVYGAGGGGGGGARAQLVLAYNVFTLNELAMETYAAAGDVDLSVTVDLVFVNGRGDNDGEGAATVNNYCSDAVLCVKNDMKLVAIDRELPFSGSSSPAAADVRRLTSDASNLIVLKASVDRFKAAPDVEYYRFKQFYHTFARGKSNKWGLSVDGRAVWRYANTLNEAMRAEMSLLFKMLRRQARRHRGTAPLPPRRGGSTSPLSRPAPPPIVNATEREESPEMQTARRRLVEAYRSCPVMLNSLDVCSVTGAWRDRYDTSIRREHARVSSKYGHVEDEAARASEQRWKVSGLAHYDTSTYPAGGDLISTSVLDALLLDEVGLNGCLTVAYDDISGNTEIRYNRYLTDLMFS